MYLFFLLSITVIVLAIALLFMSLFMSKLLKDLHAKTNNNPQSNPIDKLEVKHHNALINHEFEKLAKKQFETFSSDIENIQNTYKHTLLQIQDDNINLIKKISKDIETVLLSEGDSLKSTLEADITNLLERAGRRTDEAEKLALTQIQNYREKRIKDIEDQSFSILSSFMHTYLRKGLTKEDHEKLIQQALEQAKLEGIFNEV